MADATFQNVKAPYLTVQEIANDGSDIAVHPDADYRRLFLGEDGDLHLMDSAGTVTTPNDSGGSSPRSCRVHNSAAQTINDTSETTLTFDTEDADASGIHSGGTFTPPAGDWRITIAWEWAANATGYRIVRLKKGSAYVATDSRQPTATSGYSSGTLTYEAYGCSGSDAFVFKVIQNRGGTLGIGNGPDGVLTAVTVTEIV